MAKLWRVTREISANVMGNEAYLACILKKRVGLRGQEAVSLGAINKRPSRRSLSLQDDLFCPQEVIELLEQ